jgi:hypothetical protein
LPSAGEAPRHRRARLIAAACGLALVVGAGCNHGTKDYVVRSKTAPDTHHVAVVRLVSCDAGLCESLATGPTADTVQSIVTLPTERCTEIVWSPDSKRVGFVIDGQQLRFYEAEGHRPAGQVDLVPRDATPPTRLARGITFSDNGAAITFDDCPREKSGCRPAIIGLH